MISENQRGEFIGQIIDIFEDFLAEKDVTLVNPEIVDAISDGQDPEGLAIIYGTDYGNLQEDLEEMFRNWGILQQEGGVMKTYKVTFVEHVMHTFYIDADTEEDVEVKFGEMANNSELDFSDGDVFFSEIKEIEDVTKEETV